LAVLKLAKALDLPMGDLLDDRKSYKA